MRIGSFWGMPAPMILLAMHGEDEIMHHFSVLNTIMNKQILHDVCIEFSALSRIEGIAKVRLVKPDFLQISDSYADLLRVENGALVRQTPDSGSALNLDTLWQDLMTELAVDLAQKIVDIEARGSGVTLDCASVESLRGIVEEAAAGQDFSLSDTANFVLGIVRNMRADHSSLTPQILEIFEHTFAIADNVRIDGRKVKVSEEAKAVLEWYAQRLDLIKKLCRRNSGAAAENEMVFDLPFFDIIKRRPESLIYMVMGRFECLKERQTDHVIRAVCGDVRASMLRFRECMEKYTLEDDGGTQPEFFTAASFLEYLDSLPAEDSQLLSDLCSRDAIRPEDYSAKDFEYLLEIHKCVRALDYRHFNEVFGLNCTDCQWEELVQELRGLYVCGLNGHSQELFEESVKNISLATDVKIKKSETYFQKIEQIESDVESLISTIRGIGEVLQ